MLTILDHLRDGLLERDACDLHQILSGPTLIHLPGRRQEPLFVSVLLHGNESTGWNAARALLRRHAGRRLPRSLSLLVGNVAAARHGLRRLDGQPDFNRIWSGGSAPEHSMARQVLDEMRARRVFASVDVHNNTGFNPHYACVNHLEPPYLHLATLFSRTVVYFIKPDSVQSLAFGHLCPAVTLECGQPGQHHGDAHALEYLEACLNLSEHPHHPVPEHDIDLFHTVAVVKVPPQISFGIGESEGTIAFAPDLDHLNFQELPEGTTLGRVRPHQGPYVEAWDEEGEEVSKRFFTVSDGEIRTRIPVMPSMLTLDETVIRQDCLCYLMERYRAPGPA